jgi:hypothetical protein
VSKLWWLAEPAPKRGEGIKFVIKHGGLLVLIKDRRYFVRAVASPVSAQRLELVLYAWRNEDGIYRERVDLYDREARQRYIQEAARECKVRARTIEKDLASLMKHFEEYRDAKIATAFNEKQLSKPLLQ